MPGPKSASSLVYSTEHGRMCPGCGKPAAACACGKAQPAAQGDGIVRVSRETKGRKGKGVTLVRGVALAPLALAQLGKELKAACGSGGTVKDGVIEIQGDHCDAVIETLRQRGMTVRRAGG
ncbi:MULTISPECIES: translation initiation factor Sui1 [Cupriavidus]